MDASGRQRYAAALQALRHLRDSGAIESADFGKSAFSIAHEFMVEEELELGVSVLVELPDSYYEDQQPQQMVDDPQYALICHRVARMLQLGGYLGDVVTTKGAASA